MKSPVIRQIRKEATRQVLIQLKQRGLTYREAAEVLKMPKTNFYQLAYQEFGIEFKHDPKRVSRKTPEFALSFKVAV
jgi:hypothetical protein